MARADDDRRTVEELAADRSLLNITPYIEDGWQYKHTIGSGACGDVWRARYVRTDPTTEQKLSYSVVIKAIRGTPKERPKIEERLNREIIAWRALSHPNVAEFLGIVERKNGPPGLVSRWVQRHDFAAYMRRHPEQKRKKAQDIASGLTYLHSKGVVHGDMKIDNIVVTDELRAQIIDFGISRLVGVKGFTTLAQRNVRFSAPELIPLQENPNTVIRPTYESDIYSLGILLLQLFDGHGPSTQRGMSYNHIPYQGDYDIALSTLIHKGERPQRHRYEPMLDQHWIIIELCWQQDPSDRPAAAEVLRRL